MSLPPPEDRPEDPPDEAALIQAASEGDRDALEELLCRSLPDLRMLVKRRAGALVRGRESDSDIVQSVCREILTHGDVFQHPSEQAFRKWLYATTIRKLGQRRDRMTAQRRDVLRERSISTEEGGVLDPADAESPTPSGQLAVREELDRLEAALDALPDEYREVIVHAKIGGRSREEIAAATGRSPGAVRMLLHRAMARLAVLLDEGPTS
ncbi:MAG: sigma-70 family RNA polymerase sigma factor [Planctomycetota bacterium]